MNSRTKGKVGEREFAALLRAHGFDARRGQQFSGSPDSPDVVSEALAWLHVEVKRVQNLNLTDACTQASGDAGGKPWIVAHRRNHAPWFITMSAETFFNFLRGELPLHGNAPVAQTPEHEGQQQNNNQERTKSMKIANPNSRIEPCPEFTGRAVIVDVTPLRKEQSQFGEQEVFRVVFEVDMDKPDGSRFCVWSRRMTPTLGEKSNLRKFIRGLYGRDLTKPELANYDTEVLVGMGAQLVVVHEHKDGETYANIAACTPDKSGNSLKPTGKYVRLKDRPPKDGAGGQAAPAGNGGYRRVQSNADASGDLLATKIHVGKCTGLEVRDLSPEQVGALIQNWLPTAKANAKPTADDKRLIAALEHWQTTQAASPENDDVPY